MRAPNEKTLPVWDEAQPLPKGQPPVCSFDDELLPSVLSVSALGFSNITQAPIDFIGAAYLVALSSVVARHVAIRPKENDSWTVVPNLWGYVVGRPSAKKSPAVKRAFAPLERLETQGFDAFSFELDAFKLSEQMHDLQSKVNTDEARKKLKSGASPQSKSDAMALLEEAHDSAPKEPIRIRYVVNDSTVEKLGTLLEGNASLVVWRDELMGVFASLERQGQEGARSFYLESWDGNNSFNVDRISRGSMRITRVCLSVFGGIQPGPMAGLLRELHKNGRANDGLLQRFQIAVWPDVSKTFELVDEKPDQELMLKVNHLFESLASMDLASATQPDEGMPYLRFAPDAQKVFLDWLSKHENRLRQEEMPECMEAHLGKYASMVPSIALILHLAEGHSGPVDLESITKAIAWAKYLETHANRIYAPIIGADFVSATALARKIQARKVESEFSARDVYRNCWSGLSTSDETHAAIDVLIDFGWLHEIRKETTTRPATVYRVNESAYEVAL